MKYAADFRQMARDALRGKWLIAVITGFVASLLGAGIATGGGSSSSSNSDSFETLPGDFQNTEMWMQIQSFFMIALVILLIWAVILIIIGGAAKLGYAIFNLKLVDDKEVAFSDLFSQFHRLGDGFCMNFLVALYTFLWTLLFIIPGIIKKYSYAMTPYILAENPQMSASDAITESRRIMDGNKWRLFCLGISFIGWWLLCTLPIMIASVVIITIVFENGNWTTLLWLIPCSIPTFVGNLFLRPYQEAAYAAFYREVSKK